MNEEIITANEKISKNTKKLSFVNILLFLLTFLSMVNTAFLINITTNPDHELDKKPDVKSELKNRLNESRELSSYQEKVFDECVSYSELEVIKTEYSNRVNGNVKNNSDKDLSSISIELKEYDAFGDYVGSTSIYIEYLPANTSCKVDAYISDETESVKVLSTRAMYYDDVNS